MGFSCAVPLILWSAVCIAPVQNASSTARDALQLRQGASPFIPVLMSDAAVEIPSFVMVLLIISSVIINGCMLCLDVLFHSDAIACFPRFTLMRNLIMSDGVLFCTDFATVISCLLQKTTLQYGSWCVAQFFIKTVCVSASLLFLTFMALERFVYVCLNKSCFSILTAERLHLTVGLLWFLSVFSSAVITVYLSLRHESSLPAHSTGLLCDLDNLDTVFHKSVVLGVILLCILSYSFSYMCMFREAHNTIQPFLPINGRHCKTAIFYILNLLLHVLHIFLKIAFNFVWEREDKVTVDSQCKVGYSEGWISAEILHMMLLFLSVLPPYINPLTHGLRNRAFWKSFPPAN